MPVSQFAAARRRGGKRQRHMMVFGFGEGAAGGGNHVQAHVSLGPFPVVGPVRSEVEVESWKSVLRLVGNGQSFGI